MSAKAMQQDVVARFLANWTDDATNLRTPVAFPNVRGLLTRVDGATRLPQPPSEATDAPWYGRWVRVGFREQGVGAAALGNPGLMRKIGRVWVQVFVPLGVDTLAARDLGDQAAAIFTYQRLPTSNAMFDAPDDEGGGREVGQTESWWQYNVSVPYHRDEVAASS